jgi:hypothetical protein
MPISLSVRVDCTVSEKRRPRVVQLARIAPPEGFVRQFLGKAVENSKVSRRQVGSCEPC